MHRRGAKSIRCEAARGRRSGRVNLSLVLTLLVIAGVVGVGAVSLRKWRHRSLAAQALAEARRLEGTGDYDTASKRYQDYLERNPTDIEVLEAYAQANLMARPRESKHFRKAVGAYQELLRLRQGHEAYLDALVRLHARGQAPPDQLLYWAKQWASAHPQNARARLWLARAQTESGQYDEARKTFEEILASPEASPDAYILAGLMEARGATVAAQGLAAAAERYDAGVARFPDSAKMHAYRARFRLRVAGDNAGARADLERAEALGAADPMLHMRMFDEWSDLGELEKAEAHLRAAQAANPAARRSAVESEVVVDVGEDDESWALFLFKAEAKLALRKIGAGLMTASQVGDLAAAEEARLKAMVGREWDYLPSLTEMYAAAERGEDAQRCAEALRKLIDPASPIVETQRAIWAKAEGIAAFATNRKDSPYRVIRLPERVDIDPRILVMKALAYRRINMPARAAACLERYLRVSPEDAEALALLGQTQLEMGDWARARATAERLAGSARHAEEARLIHVQAAISELRPEQAQRDPALIEALRNQLTSLPAEIGGSAQALLLSAVLEEKSGRVAEAEALLRANLRIDDPKDLILGGLVGLLERAGRSDEAIDAARTAAEDAPDRARRWMFLAEVCLRGGRADDARSALDRAVAVTEDPGAARDARLMRARLLMETGKAEEGVGELEAMRKADPTDPACRSALLDAALSDRKGVPAFSTEQIHELINELKAIESESEGVHWRVYLARLMLRASTPETAPPANLPQVEALLSQALTLDPSRVDACLLLADLYRRRGDTVREEETYRRVLVVYPSVVEVAERLLGLLNGQMRFKEALQLIDEFEQRGVLMPAARLEVALRSDQPTEAVAALEELRAAEPGNVQALLLLAKVKFSNGSKYAEIAPLLDEAEKLGGHVPLATYLRSSMLEAEGRFDEAEAVLNREVEAHPGYAAYVMRGPYYFRRGRLAQSEADFRKLTELPDNPAEGALLLGRFYDETGNRDQALATLEAAIAAYPDHLKLEQARLEILLGSPSSEHRAAGEARLKELLAKHTEDPLLRLMQAAVLLSRPDSASRQESERILSALTASHPRILQAHLLRIQIAREQSDAEQARELLRQAKALFPRSSELLLVEADLDRSAGNLVRARQIAEEVRQREPSNAVAKMFLADLDIQAGRFSDGAFAVLEELIAADPKNEDAHLKLAVARQSAGRLEEAIAGLKSYCATHAPASAKAQALLADLLRIAGRHDEARSVLDEGGRTAPESPDLRSVRARLLASTGDYEGLSELLRAEMERKDADRAICVSGAQLLAASGRPEALATARRTFEFVTHAWPEEPEGWLGLATAAYLQGESAAARQAYEKVLESGKGRPDQQVRALNGAAWMLYVEGGDLTKALQLADRAVALGENALDPEVLDTRGHILEKSGQLARARADFERCYRIAEERVSEAPQVFRPVWAKALVNLARIALALGEKEAALGYLNQARALHTESPALDAATQAELEALLKRAGG